MLHQEPQAQAAEQTFAMRQQATDRILTESMTGTSSKMAAGQTRTAHFEACARGVRDDYSDDPVKASWWIKTVCH
jgi:hypothetical protein